ncbi:hypothetical protein NDU88_000474, partial [Pleurodeles waltl]
MPSTCASCGRHGGGGPAGPSIPRAGRKPSGSQEIKEIAWQQKTPFVSCVRRAGHVPPPHRAKQRDCYEEASTS